MELEQVRASVEKQIAEIKNKIEETGCITEQQAFDMGFLDAWMQACDEIQGEINA